MPVETVIAAARDFLGDRITTNATLRDQHSHGEDTQPPVQPDAVAFVETSDEAARLLALCHAEHVPVVPFGAGTSLEGHVTPVRGGISLDLSRMNRILEVSQPDMDCRVEAGVTREQLNTHLRDLGLFFPVDPGTAACTIGGMSATRASGTNAVRYGTMRDNVMGLTVAMPDGRLIRTGGRVRKSASGYDLTRLFVGSEGTLGVITEIQLRLHGIPEAVSSATCQFHTLRDAVETVIAILQHGIPVARMELLDDAQMARLHRLFEAGGLAGAADAVLRIPRHAQRRRRTGRPGRGDRAGVRGPRLRLGNRSGGAVRSCGRRGMMPTGRRWPGSRDTRAWRPTRSCRSPG